MLGCFLTALLFTVPNFPLLSRAWFLISWKDELLNCVTARLEGGKGDEGEERAIARVLVPLSNLLTWVGIVLDCCGFILWTGPPLRPADMAGCACCCCCVHCQSPQRCGFAAAKQQAADAACVLVPPSTSPLPSLCPVSAVQGIVATAGMTAMVAFGVNVQPLLTFGSISTVAVGFAAQSTMQNVVSALQIVSRTNRLVGRQA